MIYKCRIYPVISSLHLLQQSPPLLFPEAAHTMGEKEIESTSHVEQHSPEGLSPEDREFLATLPEKVERAAV